MADAIAEAFVTLRPDTSGFGKEAQGGIKASLGKLALGLGAAGAGIGAVALKFAGDFDKAYDTIRAGTGATGDVLKGLEDDFRAVVKDVPTDFGTAGNAVADLNTRLGLTGAALQARSAQFINLSRITGSDLQGSIADLTRVFGDWGVATEGQEGTLDRLFRASQVSGIGVNELGQKLVQFGAPLRQMGFSLQESTALLAKWEKEGVNGELVLGSLRIAMGSFARENVPMREGLDRTIATIQELGPGARATTLAMEVFGARAGPDMAAAILEGRFAVEDYLAQIEGGTDTINAVAADTDSWRENLTVLRNRGLVALEGPMTAVFDGMTGLIDVISTRAVPWIETHLTPALRSLAGTFRSDVLPVLRGDVLPVLRRLAGDVLGALAVTLRDDVQPRLEAFGAFLRDTVLPAARDLGGFLGGHVLPPLRAFGEWLAGHKDVLVAVGVAWAAFTATTQAFAAVQGIQAAFAAMATGIRGVNMSLLAPPGIALAIAAIAAAIFLVWQNGDEIWPKLETGWRWMKERAADLAEAVTGFFDDIWSGVTGTVARLKDWLLANWEALVTGVLAVVFPPGAGLFLLVTHFDEVKAGISGIWQGIKNAVGGVVDWFDEHVLGFFRAMPQTIGGALRGLAEVITAPYRVAFEGIRRVVNAIASAVNAIPAFGIPDWVPGIGGHSFSLPQIPYVPALPAFDLGGVVPGLLGEPVPILAHAGETVLPTHRGQPLTHVPVYLGGHLLVDLVVEGLVTGVRTGRVDPGVVR